MFEPKVISKAPPEELVVSPDFIEAKDFVQTVKVKDSLLQQAGRAKLSSLF